MTRLSPEGIIPELPATVGDSVECLHRGGRFRFTAIAINVWQIQRAGNETWTAQLERHGSFYDFGGRGNGVASATGVTLPEVFAYLI